MHLTPTRILVDQAEYVVGFASEWLELDSPDEGVRYDSEIVGYTITISISRLKLYYIGTASRTTICILFGANECYPPVTSSQPTNIFLRARCQRLSFLDVNISVHDTLSPHSGLRCSSGRWGSRQGSEWLRRRVEWYMGNLEHYKNGLWSDPSDCCWYALWFIPVTPNTDGDVST